MTRLHRGLGYGLALSLPLWALLASCLHAQDSVRTFKVPRTYQADSVVVYRTRTVDTVRPTDTTVTPPPTSAKGIGIGPFNGTPGSLGTLFINANTPAGLKSQLAASGYSVCAAPTGGSHTQYMTNGRWDYNKWKAKIDTYRADSATWRKAFQAGKLPCVSILDEPSCASCWGGRSIPWNLVSQAACYARPIFGGAPIFTRSNPRQVPAGTACVEGSIGQYDQSMGSVKVWAAAEMAAAKAKNLVWLGGVNAENGGKVVSGCQKSVTRPGKCRMAGAELLTNIMALGADSSRTCGSSMWFGDAAQYASYTARADNRATLNTLIAWGRTRSRPARCGG